MNNLMISLIRPGYRGIIKNILFLIDPEWVHTHTISLAQFLGKFDLTNKLVSLIFKSKDPSLQQSLFDLSFESPVGLAAGFDYEARLTQILPSLGFGFGTVGTLTKVPHEGNPKPRLGRLPRSHSLMVNKGFKNLGIAETLKTLEGKTFQCPIGISIGKTNTNNHTTQQEAVEDIVAAFKMAELSDVPFSYYELNISCPNLKGSIEFYNPQKLEHLLKALDSLKIRRPVFVKMPISKSNEEVKEMMSVIVKYPYIKAVIIGNLQRDRSHPALVRGEVEQFSQGNFSGAPCRDRSDELISLVYQDFGKKIKIIGCGGIFSVQDAYRKIKLGASLVQLITGLVYRGPQLVAEINIGLGKLLRKDRYSSLREVVGTSTWPQVL